MSLSRQKILRIWITTSPKKIILEYINKCLFYTSKKLTKPFVVVTPNAEQIVLTNARESFVKTLNKADVALPDGFPVARMLGIKRIPGVEFMEDLVGVAAERGVRIGLIGGAPGVAVEALECLTKKFPGLLGWTAVPEAMSMEEIVKKIRLTGTKMVFVGLGAPKQEEFIERLVREMSFRPASRNPAFEKKKWIPDQVRDDNKKLILMSVGGSFDIIAGRLKRAPLLIRSIGFEWAWRLAREPWRWRRQLALFKFVVLILKEKIRTR